MYKIILLILLYLSNIGVSKGQQVKVPADNFDLIRLIENDSSHNVDSINWIRNGFYCNENSLNGCPLYGDIIINNVIEVCGDNFYRFSDSAIVERLNQRIETTSQSVVNQTEIVAINYEEYLNASKLVTLPKFEEQLWESNSRFIANIYNPPKYSSTGSKYINLINSITCDTINQLWNGEKRNFRIIKNRDSIIYAIKNLKDNDLKFALLLTFIEKLTCLECNWDDVEKLYYALNDDFLKSEKYSDRQKAMMYIAFGKAFNTYNKTEFDARNAFIFFRLAESILLSNKAQGKLENEYFKLEQIIFDHVLNQKDAIYIKYLKKSATSFLFQKNTSSSIENKFISIPGYFTEILKIANYELALAHLDLKNNGILMPRRLLIVSCVLYSLTKLINNREIKSNEILTRAFNALLCDYYRLILRPDKAASIQKQVIVNSKKLSNAINKFRCIEDIRKLSDIERDMGNITLAKALFHITEPPLTKKYGYDSVTTSHFVFSFPSDFRLWNNHHFVTLIDSVNSVDNLNARSDPRAWRFRMSVYETFELDMVQLVKILGRWSLNQGYWKSGALLMLKADSLKIDKSDDLISVYSAGILGDYFPNIYKKENTIKDLIIYLVVVGATLIIIGGLAVWAIRERKRARREEAKSTILAQTMRQIGHLAPQCINEILDDHEESLGDYLYSKLKKLSELLQQFYDYSRKDKITYSQELSLVKDFVDLSYESTQNPNPSSFIAANDKSYSEIPQPKYVLFNAIQNAYKYSRKSIFNGGIMSVVISEEGGGYRMRIVNSLNEPKTGKPEPGSGIEYMGKVLVNKTRIPKSRLDYGYDQEEFYLTYTFKP